MIKTHWFLRFVGMVTPGLIAILAGGCVGSRGGTSSEEGRLVSASSSGSSGRSAHCDCDDRGRHHGVDPDQILGFETLAGWSVDGRGASLTTQRTQGDFALALANPKHETDLVSAPVALTAAALAGIADQNSSFAIDVRVPIQLADSDNAGSIQLFVSVPSHGIHRVNLGKFRFQGTRLGLYQTVKFPISDAVRQALSGSSCGALVFHLKLHAPRASGTYLFDHLRVHAPSTPPAGAGQSVDLVAQLSYAPPASTPGEASFPVGVVQVPQSFHVKLGSAGSGSASLDLGYGSTPFTTCTFAGHGDSYVLSSCTGGYQAGDLVGADHARLTIVSGDPSAGTTKVRAQLAVNPLGDIVGPGLLPPMPTWWGDTPSVSSQIVTDYFNTVNTASRTEERWIKTPTPEFARLRSDLSVHDNLTGPPPPNDPDFDQEQHLGSGNWDAYWRLNGSLSSDFVSNHNKTHFDAALGAHVVLWGNDVEVARAALVTDADNGDVTTPGLDGQSFSGSLHAYLFGAEIPGGGSFDPSGTISFNIQSSNNYDLPPIDIWIFSITIGANASAGVQAAGVVSPAGLNLNITPSASAGAHLEGDVSIGIASGGVSATIDLIKVATPMTASANWLIDTSPTGCAATFTYGLDGRLTLSTLGGEVDLEATFGFCPFCDHESWTLFKWNGLDLGTQTIFHFQDSQSIGLDHSICILPLSVTQTPPTPQPVLAQVEVMLHGSAHRPPSAGQPPDLIGIDCQYFSWTSDNPADPMPLATGTCDPTVKFTTAGVRTVRLTVTDQYGETGYADQVINVGPAPAGPIPSITAPVATGGSAIYVVPVPSSLNLPLAGTYDPNGSAGPVVLTWTAVDSHGVKTPIGTGLTATFTPQAFDGYDIVLTAEDTSTHTVGPPASIHVTVEETPR
jgi:hypothetical protein